MPIFKTRKAPSGLIKVRSLRENLLLGSTVCTIGQEVEIPPHPAAMRLVMGEVELVEPDEAEASKDFRDALHLEKHYASERRKAEGAPLTVELNDPRRKPPPPPVMVEIRALKAALFGSVNLEIGGTTTLEVEIAAARILEGLAELVDPDGAPRDYTQAFEREKQSRSVA